MAGWSVFTVGTNATIVFPIIMWNNLTFINGLKLYNDGTISFVSYTW